VFNVASLAAKIVHPIVVEAVAFFWELRREAASV
jgi:hypothetical protein